MTPLWAIAQQVIPERGVRRPANAGSRRRRPCTEAFQAGRSTSLPIIEGCGGLVCWRQRDLNLPTTKTNNGSIVVVWEMAACIVSSPPGSERRRGAVAAERSSRKHHCRQAAHFVVPEKLVLQVPGPEMVQASAASHPYVAHLTCFTTAPPEHRHFRSAKPGKIDGAVSAT